MSWNGPNGQRATYQAGAELSRQLKPYAKASRHTVAKMMGITHQAVALLETTALVKLKRGLLARLRE